MSALLDTATQEPNLKKKKKDWPSFIISHLECYYCLDINRSVTE